MMEKTKLFFLFLLLPLTCEATDLKPWFENEYEAVMRSSVLYQNYHSIAIPHHPDFKPKENFNREQNDAFITLSALYPFKRYCGEFEATAAYTRYEKFRWDNFRITGRYLMAG